MLLKLLKIIVLSCYLTAIAKGLTIKELSAEDDIVATTINAVTETSYRQTVAKVKEAPYRVPEHLQFVAKGFIYEDADDVIHVIDPPKHFEELKKMMQHQQQQHPLGNRRPIALRRQKPKPKIIQTMVPAKHKGVPAIQRKPDAEIDLRTQESVHLPVEILASVRRTENYIRKYKPKLPSVRQRLKTHKIQTVIWEQQQEQQQYQQGQQQKLQAVKEQTAKRRHLNVKRFKRAAAANDYKTLKGEELLLHINELIKNASTYLEQTENYDDYPDDTEFETTTLQGELLVKTTKEPAGSSGNVTLNEDMIVKILENSIKATNVIMQQIKTQTNLTTIGQKCNYLKVTYPNHIQNLQNQIKCMQNFIKDLNQTQQQHQRQWHRHQPKYRASPTKYSKHLESRKTSSWKNKPFLMAQLAEDYIDDAPPPYPLNSSLIYNDVMTTIRNMLLTQHLQSIDDSTDSAAGSVNSPWPNAYGEETFFTHDKSAEPVDFHDLHEYLISLENIVTNLPKFNHKSLHFPDTEGGASSKYYFINPQGSIYNLPQPFQKDTTTTAPTTIFHQFPDLPSVKEYLKNRTLLTPSSFSAKVVEIL